MFKLFKENKEPEVKKKNKTLSFQDDRAISDIRVFIDADCIGCFTYTSDKVWEFKTFKYTPAQLGGFYTSFQLTPQFSCEHLEQILDKLKELSNL